MIKKRIVVVGSGFGGLAVALRLLAVGHDVTILEKREKIGGRAYQIKDKGYTFDTGPSLITAPSLFRDLFFLFSKKIEDYVELVPLDPFYRIYFEKGKDDVDAGDRYAKVDYNGDVVHMKEELEKLEVGAGLKYDSFFAKLKPIYESAYLKLGARPFLSVFSFLKVLPEMFRLDAIRSVYSIASSFFNDERARRLYSFHPLYIGTHPGDAPGALSFIPYLEREEGVWYAKGGMYTVVEALGRLFEEHGGKIICGAEVSELRMKANIVEKVITKSGNEFDCDLVISNGDIVRTHQMLTHKSLRTRFHIQRWKKADYSMSLYLFYFGLNKQYHNRLAHHTLILCKEYDELLQEIFHDKKFPSSLSMYLHVPTITDATMAPPGCESMYILVPMPNLSGNVSWDEHLNYKVRELVVNYLEKSFGLEGFREAIAVEKTFAPQDFETQLNSTYGAAFGPALTLFQSIYFRQHNKSDSVSNLYFVGAGTHPGPGVPGVLKTAECTANLILSGN